MFPTLPESTPELEACAQLKNLHTSFFANVQTSYPPTLHLSL